MTAPNKANMDAMMEKMNALVSGAVDRWTNQQDKEYTPPGEGNRRPPMETEGTKKHRKQKALCPPCKTFVLHKLEICYELKANKAKRWSGWKSVNATA